MKKNMTLIKNGEYEKVNNHELLTEVSLHITSNIELLETIIKSVENIPYLEGTLEVLQRDLVNTNDIIDKYLYDN